MLNHCFSLHSYWIFNSAIALGYLLAWSILSLPFMSNRIPQQQKLKFAKWSLVIAVLAFFIVPYLGAQLIPISHSGNFQLQPVLKHASNTFLQNHTTVKTNINKLDTSRLLPSFSTILSIGIVIGFFIALKKYLAGILFLQQLIKKSFCLRKLKNLHIYVDKNSTIPFCWSCFNKHFIIIPEHLLEHGIDLKLAIRHELQHLRQGDTQWLHMLALINLFCFWNPFFNLWKKWFVALQEFSCDEALVLRKNTSPLDYAQCLLDTAAHATHLETLPHGALGIMGSSKQNNLSILHRRIDMLFHYAKRKKMTLSIFLAYSLCLLMASSFAFAFAGNTTTHSLSAEHVANLVNRTIPMNALQVSATPEVITEINNMRLNAQERAYMRNALQNMKQYQPYILAELRANHMPEDLLALPLVESGYRPLDEKLNRLRAAGIWQFIPSTANRFGLLIDKQRDDRLDTNLATKAALTYLNALHAQFNDWKLATLAYEYGEDQTAQLMKITGSHNPWVLVRSSAAPVALKKFLAMYDASVIVIHNPTLVTDKL